MDPEHDRQPAAATGRFRRVDVEVEAVLVGARDAEEAGGLRTGRRQRARFEERVRLRGLRRGPAQLAHRRRRIGDPEELGGGTGDHALHLALGGVHERTRGLRSRRPRHDEGQADERARQREPTMAATGHGRPPLPLLRVGYCSRPSGNIGVASSLKQAKIVACPNDKPNARMPGRAPRSPTARNAIVGRATRLRPANCRIGLRGSTALVAGAHGAVLSGGPDQTARHPAATRVPIVA